MASPPRSLTKPLPPGSAVRVHHRLVLRRGRRRRSAVFIDGRLVLDVGLGVPVVEGAARPPRPPPRYRQRAGESALQRRDLGGVGVPGCSGGAVLCAHRVGQRGFKGGDCGGVEHGIEGGELLDAGAQRGRQALVGKRAHQNGVYELRTKKWGGKQGNVMRTDTLGVGRMGFPSHRVAVPEWESNNTLYNTSRGPHPSVRFSNTIASGNRSMGIQAWMAPPMAGRAPRPAGAPRLAGDNQRKWV